VNPDLISIIFIVRESAYELANPDSGRALKVEKIETISKP